MDGLRTVSPDVIVNGVEETTAPHILSVSLAGVDAEMMLIRLSREGIAVSMGSACNSESIEPSHVLTAMRIPSEQINSTLRISLGMQTTPNDIDVLLDTMMRVLPRAVLQ